MSLSDIELRDLRLYSGRDLRTLLAEEARLWREQLRWDYTRSIELLSSYLDSRILPGFVARNTHTGMLDGYCFSVYEAQKAVVGDVFATGPNKALIQTVLLNYLLPMLQHTPGVTRIESQLLLESSSLQDAFSEGGFLPYPRIFMEAALPGTRELIPPGSLVRSADEPPPELPSNLRLLPWTAPFYQPAGDLIHRAYAGHSDAEINDQYRTVQGSLRFLHNIVRFPGCGVFDPDHSFVLREERSGQMEGLVLVSRVEPDVAHVTQLCVSPRRRGQGIGTMLLRHAATELASHAIRAVTLTVTEANTGAVSLYRRLGFTDRTRFFANVWTR